MEKIKSMLSPGKQVEDEIMYGSGHAGQYEHTGSEVPGSTSGYYGAAGGESQIYNRERDSIPSQPASVQEYGKTDEEYSQAEKERAAKYKVAKEQSTKEGLAREEKQARHKKSHSGEINESRNPYTQQAVDPRLGGADESKAVRNGQPPVYATAADAARTTQSYEREDAAGRGGKGAATAGLAGAASAAGAAGAAGTSSQGQGQVKAIPLETDSPHGEVVGRTISGHHTVERTASGQYRTRLASIIDPNYGEGVSKPESAYEHTPGGGGAYEADVFHGRESRVASLTLPGGQKYTDPEAAEDHGLGYKPGGVAYTTPAAAGYGEGGGRSMPGAYEGGDYGRQGQPQVATTKSEAARALSGDQTSHKGAGAGTAAGAGVIGAAVADAGFGGTKADKAHPQPAEDRAYRTSRSHVPDATGYTTTHPAKAKETTPKTTTTQKAEKPVEKAAAKAAPAQRVDETAYAAKPPATKYGDVDVPPGNHYGKVVKDPRYGLPMAAAGISAEEAAALRRNEANVARPSTADRDYAGQPTTANQAYPTQPTTQAQQQAAKTPTKEEKPSRRSSILGFLHLGKDKDKKRHSKEEKRLSDTKRQSYPDQTGGAVAGTGAAYGGQQAPVPGSVTRHDQPADLAYRNRMPSTADAPAFTGGLVGPNGAPLKDASAGNADSSSWAKSTERDIMDRGGMGQGTSNQAAYGGAGTTNQAAYGGTGTANQSAYGTGIDESYANEPTVTGANQKSGSHGVATTGGAIAAGAAAGGLAAGGMHGSKAQEGVASDYNMQSAQGKGAPTNDALYDQVSPRSSAANKKAQETNHKTNHTKETKTSNHNSHGHKEKNSTAYAGSDDAQARDAAYGGYTNDSQLGSAAQGGYGSSPQSKAPAYDTYGNGAESNSAAYGGKETRASNAAYGNEGYSGQGAQADEAYGGESNGVSRHGTTKVAERAGHHVLHKDPPASHPAAAAAGLE